MTKKSEVDLVNDFIEQAGAAPTGSKCSTCALKNVRAIERAALHFNAKRRDRVTTAAWTTFVRTVLKAKLGYPRDHRALIRHMERCLGQKVA